MDETILRATVLHNLQTDGRPVLQSCLHGIESKLGKQHIVLQASKVRSREESIVCGGMQFMNMISCVIKTTSVKAMGICAIRQRYTSTSICISTSFFNGQFVKSIFAYKTHLI